MVRESVPVKPGPLTLLYPQWLPGTHGPNGPVNLLTGLIITARGRRLPWLRDPVNMYAFHIDVPADPDQADLEFQFASPQTADRGIPETDERSVRPLRHALVRSLRLPASAHRELKRHRSRAPPFQRERAPPGTLHRVGQKCSGARSARARADAFLEWQASQAGRSLDGQLQC